MTSTRTSVGQLTRGRVEEMKCQVADYDMHIKHFALYRSRVTEVLYLGIIAKKSSCDVIIVEISIVWVSPTIRPLQPLYCKNSSVAAKL